MDAIFLVMHFFPVVESAVKPIIELAIEPVVKSTVEPNCAAIFKTVFKG